MLNLVAGTFTRFTIFLSGPLGITQLLQYNPRRLYVEFRRGPTAVAFREVVPGPVPVGYAGRDLTTDHQPYKFADCPSMVGGEWYSDMVAGTDYYIFECIAQPG